MRTKKQTPLIKLPKSSMLKPGESVLKTSKRLGPKLKVGKVKMKY